MRANLLSLVVAICCWPCAAWADLSLGRKALAEGDYPSALSELRPLAERGDAEACLLLGRMAENGWGMPQSDVAAWRWYKAAADRGEPQALLRAGEFAESGRGVPLDRRLAFTLYQRAAEAGSAPAYRRMGEMALNGWGRKADAADGVLWLRQAAAAGDREAAETLAALARQRPQAPEGFYSRP